MPRKAMRLLISPYALAILNYLINKPKKMNKFAEGLGMIVMGLLIIFGISVLGGTILWLIWEDSITGMFPKAVETGVLAATLTWWQSVKITWIFSILIKATNSTTNKTKEK